MVASRTPARGGSLGKVLGARGETGWAVLAAGFTAVFVPALAGLAAGFAVFATLLLLAIFVPWCGLDNLKNPRFDKPVARSYVSRAAADPIWRFFTPFRRPDVEDFMLGALAKSLFGS